MHGRQLKNEGVGGIAAPSTPKFGDRCEEARSVLRRRSVDMPQEEQHRHHAAAAVVPGRDSSLSPSPVAAAAVMGCGLAVGATKRRKQEHGGALPHVVASSSQSKIDGATEAAPGGARHGQSQTRASASGTITHTGTGGDSTSKGDKASSSFAERPTAGAGIVIGGGGGKKQRSSAPPPPPVANKDRREREREPDEAEYYWLGVQAAMEMDDATLDAEVKKFIVSKGVGDQRSSRHRRQEAEGGVEKKPFSSFRLADEEAEADLIKISRWAKDVDRQRAAEAGGGLCQQETLSSSPALSRGKLR